jgi:hypothetical protein
MIVQLFGIPQRIVNVLLLANDESYRKSHRVSRKLLGVSSIDFRQTWILAL